MSQNRECDMNQRQVFELIKSVSGQCNILTVPRLFLDKLDSDFPAALMLSQIIYWSDKTKRNDGFIYKTDADWVEEIGISRHQARNARKKLDELHIIETKIMRANGSPTVHYRLIEDEFLKWIGPPGPIEIPKKGQSLTEITPETTTPIDDTSKNDPNKSGETSQDDGEVTLEWLAELEKNKPTQLKREPDGTKLALEKYAQKQDGNAEIENYIVKLPERVRPIARVFCEYFGRAPIKKENSYWRTEWEAQADLGLLPKHIKLAISDMENNGLHIKSPASVTSIAERYKREGVTKAPGAGVTQVWKGGERIK